MSLPPGETSSAAAKYLIQVLIDQNLERENIILYYVHPIFRCADTPNKNASIMGRAY